MYGPFYIHILLFELKRFFQLDLFRLMPNLEVYVLENHFTFNLFTIKLIGFT